MLSISIDGSSLAPGSPSRPSCVPSDPIATHPTDPTSASIARIQGEIGGISSMSPSELRAATGMASGDAWWNFSGRSAGEKISDAKSKLASDVQHEDRAMNEISDLSDRFAKGEASDPAKQASLASLTHQLLGDIEKQRQAIAGATGSIDPAKNKAAANLASSLDRAARFDTNQMQAIAKRVDALAAPYPSGVSMGGAAREYLQGSPSTTTVAATGGTAATQAAFSAATPFAAQQSATATQAGLITPKTCAPSPQLPPATPDQAALAKIQADVEKYKPSSDETLKQADGVTRFWTWDSSKTQTAKAQSRLQSNAAVAADAMSEIKDLASRIARGDVHDASTIQPALEQSALSLLQKIQTEHNNASRIAFSPEVQKSRQGWVSGEAQDAQLSDAAWDATNLAWSVDGLKKDYPLGTATDDVFHHALDQQLTSYEGRLKSLTAQATAQESQPMSDGQRRQVLDQLTQVLAPQPDSADGNALNELFKQSSTAQSRVHLDKSLSDAAVNELGWDDDEKAKLSAAWTKANSVLHTLSEPLTVPASKSA